MKGELRGDIFIMRGLRIPVEDAKAVLCRIYPALVDAFVVKTKVVTSGSSTSQLCEVDWQGCLLDPLTKAILNAYFIKKEEYHAK